MEWYKSNLPSDLKEFHIGHHVMVRQHSYRESFEDSMARHFALDSLDEFKEVYTGKSFRQIFEEEQVKYAAALNEGASDATS